MHEVTAPPARAVASSYVVSEVRLPTLRGEFALDLNGDGVPDNQLAGFVDLLAWGEYYPQTTVRAAIAGGDSVLLLAVERAPGELDAEAAVTVAQGTPRRDPDFGGGGLFTVAPSALAVRPVLGALRQRRFVPVSPALTSHPTDVTIALPLFPPARPLPLRLHGASLQFVVDGEGHLVGQINGSLRVSEIDEQLVPAWADAITRQVASAPASTHSGQLLYLLDHGCSDGSGAAADGVISACEVRDFLHAVLRADVEIHDASGAYAPSPANQHPDSISLGFGFTAVPALLTAPR